MVPPAPRRAAGDQSGLTGSGDDVLVPSAGLLGFNALNQRVNLEIMRAFEKERIQFALPSSATYLAQEDQSALQVSLVGQPQ